MVFKKYTNDYEDGRCPHGYEYVGQYTDSHNVFHRSYCRKIRIVRKSDEDKQEELRKKMDQKMKNQIDKAYAQLDDHMHIGE